MTELTPVARMEAARRELPFAVQRVTQFIVDNPLQMGVCAAGGLVLAMAARNICRPRNTLELLALMAMFDVAAGAAAKQVIERGWLSFRVRDADGNLVPLRPSKAGE